MYSMATCLALMPPKRKKDIKGFDRCLEMKRQVSRVAIKHNPREITWAKMRKDTSIEKSLRTLINSTGKNSISLVNSQHYGTKRVSTFTGMTPREMLSRRENPSRVRSIILPFAYGPRSVISTSIDFPLSIFVTRTRDPNFIVR